MILPAQLTQNALQRTLYFRDLYLPRQRFNNALGVNILLVKGLLYRVLLRPLQRFFLVCLALTDESDSESDDNQVLYVKP